MSGADEFDLALLSSVSVLRALPGEREHIEEARKRFIEFAKSHPSLRTDFVVDLQPGRERASYDILLDHPNGGTIAVSWSADHASPWLADYAEHWAANYVVSIGDAHLTVQDALSSLRLLAGEDAGLLDRLIEDALIRKAVVDRRLDCTATEVQAAMDDTRQSLGLHSAAATHDWLAKMGWSEHEFESLVAGGLRVRMLRVAIVGDRADAHFAAHRAWFDVVRVCQAETRSREIATRLVTEAKDGLSAAGERLGAPELDQVEVTVRSVRAVELPVELRDLSVGSVAGLQKVSDRFRVSQILGRREAQLDEDTRAAVADSLFREWLAEQRRSATIRWHWL